MDLSLENSMKMSWKFFLNGTFFGVAWCCIEAQCFSDHTCIQLNITVHFIVQVPNQYTDDITLHISSFFLMS